MQSQLCDMWVERIFFSVAHGGSTRRWGQSNLCGGESRGASKRENLSRARGTCARVLPSDLVFFAVTSVTERG